MANVIQKATNKFTKGLVMDFSPENTPNEVLSHALNATLLTFNGNEMSLQNDMGNARVETAYLPEGYMPVGTCEYGGIIYIVSYNPLEDKSQIGCFPSPERNVSNEELGLSDAILKNEYFQPLEEDGKYRGNISNFTYTIQLRNDNLNPGDKFIVSSTDSIYKEKLLDLKYQTEEGELVQVEHPIIKLSIVSIEDSGRITYLDSSLRQYKHNNYSYHIIGEDSSTGGTTQKIDIDSYRNVLSSGYNVFKSKISGKLAILAELIAIDAYSITHSLIPVKDESNDQQTLFDLIIHADVSPEINEDNYLTAPKLSYYLLDNQDYKVLFIDKNGEQKESSYFKDKFTDQGEDIKLNQIIDVSNYPFPTEYEIKLSELNNKFYDNETYYAPNINKEFTGDLTWDYQGLLVGNYTNYFIRFNRNEMYFIDPQLQLKQSANWLKEISAKFYIPQMSDENLEIDLQTVFNMLTNAENPCRHLLIVPEQDYYLRLAYFVPHVSNNFKLYLSNNTQDSSYLPCKDNNFTYEDIKIATFEIPRIVKQNKDEFNCVYNYRLTPCMNYGKLSHLAISNSINIGNIFAFDKSNFNVWKYRIDGNQLRLTFGAEVFDLDQANKVDALVLEFYDLWGFAGSLEISGKKSYSGTFTKLIQLNTLDALSKQKISNNTYHNDYVHNIQISRAYDDSENVTYTHDSKPVTHNPETGWTNIEENDCGVLYSNMIYGVKAYLRQSDSNNNYIFTHCQDFFLFTLPIYNDYYYTCNNFHTELTNPSLDLGITYKLVDTGNVEPLNLAKSDEEKDQNIDNGYNETDKTNLDCYTSGKWYDTEDSVNSDNATSFYLTKYYKYTGTSNLFLELGLAEKYNSINLVYDRAINNYFTCKLQLLGNDGVGPLLVTSSLDKSTEEILCYDKGSNSDLKTTLNTIKFKDSADDSLTTFEIKSNFNDYNFLDNQGTKSISIDYKFIVGYRAAILNIVTANIPATTVTALCHKSSPTGTYNYKDFGIYEQSKEDSEPVFLSKEMYYNGGSADEEIFGICQQTSDDSSKSVYEICNTVQTVYTSANDIKIPGKLNAQAMREVCLNIGKLSFCTPHVHSSLNERYGVNIHGTTPLNIFELLGIDAILNISSNLGQYRWKADNGEFKEWKEEGNSMDHTYGIAVSDEYAQSPKFNLVLNTYKSLEQNSEFISTIYYKEVNGRQRGFDLHGDYFSDVWATQSLKSYQNREFIGFNAQQLAKFNELLIQTMKGIYAYNPDYNYVTSSTGNTLIQDNEIKFNSNIIISDAKLLNKEKPLVINDYLGLGSSEKYMKISDYLTELENHSNISVKNDNDEFLSQINFTVDLTNCGADIPVLVSSLTYQATIPDNMYKELLQQDSSKVIIIHEDGSRSYVEGTLDRKALYGFVDNKLIQLDVSNYQIDESGVLKVLYAGNGIPNYIQSGVPKTTKMSAYNSTSTTVNNSYNQLVNQNNQFVTGNNVFNYTEYTGNTTTGNTTGGTVTDGITTDSVSKDSLNAGGTIGSVIGSLEDIVLSYATPPKYYPITSTKQTTEYSQIAEDNTYQVDGTYEKARFRGTSIVINDLEYNPDSQHRLFIKNISSKCLSNGNPRNIIYYRELPTDLTKLKVPKDESDNTDGVMTYEDYNILLTWGATDNKYQHKNHLYLYTGPCFTTDNLEPENNEQ